MKKTKNKRDAQASLDFIIDNMVMNKDFELKVNEMQETLDDHTRQLNNIQTDIKTLREKRMQLEVRVDHVEKHLKIKPPVGTVS